jgi:hypothetical protein
MHEKKYLFRPQRGTATGVDAAESAISLICDEYDISYHVW